MQAAIKTDTSEFDALCDRLIEGTDPSQGGPMQDGMLAASDVYHEAQRQRFAAASARDGTWAEHAPSTIKRRGPGAPILNETGALEESMSRDGANHVLEIQGDEVVEGTADPKAQHHQSGTPRMPERSVLVEPDAETLEAMGKPIAGAVLAVAKNPRMGGMSDADLSGVFGIELV